MSEVKIDVASVFNGGSRGERVAKEKTGEILVDEGAAEALLTRDVGVK